MKRFMGIFNISLFVFSIFGVCSELGFGSYGVAWAWVVPMIYSALNLVAILED